MNIEEEIDYVINFRNKDTEFVRPYEKIRVCIYDLSCSVFPLDSFFNDFERLFNDGKIDSKFYKSAINDLYLVALQFMNYA